MTRLATARTYLPPIRGEIPVAEDVPVTLMTEGYAELLTATQVEDLVLREASGERVLVELLDGTRRSFSRHLRSRAN